MVPSDGVEGLYRGEEVAGDELCALVYELVEGVLAVGAGLAPDYGTSGVAACDGRALACDALAVGLHVALLEVRCEA